ncbi:MAG: 4-(cytidine 5'-diphospho)-2-C-methyl-D-erythritol kinase [Planctomycetota bacterium]|jgi:4-diphosphocytidyl-2-C-methyl-D-erythritol kinase
MPDEVQAKAPAKLNLALSVGPADDEGMHPICTWMVTVDLWDELLVTRLEEDRFSRYAILWHADAKRCRDIDWSMTRDLAVQAHLALENRVGRRLPVQLKLEKRIPVGGGLGGGSSDAAAMLRAVNELFDLGLSIDDLRRIAAGLGSDVPFFVSGGSATVEGLGERIEVHDAVREVHAVIAFPEASCPTGQVYGLLDELEPGPLQPDAVRALAASRGVLRSETIFNDLARPALRLAPQLEGHRRALAELAKRAAHVAGSGSSLFVLCDDQRQARTLADAVERRLGLPAVAVRSAPGPEVRPRGSASTRGCLRP